jgi:hypothetical protein
MSSALLKHRHNHCLKGSLYCGTCGYRLATEHSRSRNGQIYDYFYCLGRQYHPERCDWSVVRLNKVEQLIVDHYKTVKLPPDRIMEIRDSLNRALSSKRTKAEAEEKSLTLRIQRLTNQRQKLLQLRYADALSLDQFKEEQERLTKELKRARDLLADVSPEFDQIEKNLDWALRLASDCSPPMRRLGPTPKAVQPGLLREALCAR